MVRVTILGSAMGTNLTKKLPRVNPVLHVFAVRERGYGGTVALKDRVCGVAVINSHGEDNGANRQDYWTRRIMRVCGNSLIPGGGIAGTHRSEPVDSGPTTDKIKGSGH